MADISAVFVGLIFVGAVVGLIVVNDIDSAHSYQNSSDSEYIESNQLPEDKIVKALNEMDGKLLVFFSDLKEDLGI